MGSAPRSCWSLRCSDFGFEADHPTSINRPLCGINIVLYFLYRAVVFLYFIVYFIYDLVTTIQGFDGVRTFIYLTTWMYILFNIYVALVFFNTVTDLVIFFHNPGQYFADVTPTRYKFQWLFFDIALNGTVVICVAFWSTYYHYPGIQVFFPNMVRNINLHLLPSIFMVIDLLITSAIVRFVHVIYPAIVGCMYIVFALVYWRAGGTNPWGLNFIYPMLDFSGDGRAAGVFVVVMVAAMITVQVLMKGVYLSREWATRKVSESYSSADGSGMEHRRLTDSSMELPNRSPTP